MEEPLEDWRAAAYLKPTLEMMAMSEEDHEQVARIEVALVLFQRQGTSGPAPNASPSWE